MSLVLTRIDNRLIHGQVLEAWVPYVMANCIVVANDEVALNPLKKMMMQASVPSRMRVEIGTIAEVVGEFLDGAFERNKTLLLFGSSSDAVRAYRSGLTYVSLNLGNLHAAKGKVKLSCTIFLGEDDISELDFLERSGVEINARCVPGDSDCSWRKLLSSGKG
jgi:PTS system mannose-specific IIB component